MRQWRLVVRRCAWIGLLVLWAMPLYAQHMDESMVVLDCQVTPAVNPDYLPMEKPKTSNNLRRKEGAGIVANGMYAEIKGVVLDRFCVPVSNVLVYLWQADKAGNYRQYYTLKSEWDTVDEQYDENFAYSGTARTNNRGEFYFLTIFPGAYDNRAPHLNIALHHREWGNLDTQIFFSRHPRNQRDPVFKKLSSKEQSLLTAKSEPLDASYSIEGRRYHVTITLDGQNRFQRY